jgi:DNA-binding response OmpR family regulator
MYDRLRVLIVEDQNLLSVLMQIAIEDAVPSDIFICDTIATANKVVEDDFDLTLLDVDLRDGFSYDIARNLQSRKVPFTFVSGIPQQTLPLELRDAPFIRKPFREIQIRDLARSAYQRKSGHDSSYLDGITPVDACCSH